MTIRSSWTVSIKWIKFPKKANKKSSDRIAKKLILINLKCVSLSL